MFQKTLKKSKCLRTSCKAGFSFTSDYTAMIQSRAFPKHHLTVNFIM